MHPVIQQMNPLILELRKKKIVTETEKRRADNREPKNKNIFTTYIANMK